MRVSRSDATSLPACRARRRAGACRRRRSRGWLPSGLQRHGLHRAAVIREHGDAGAARDVPDAHAAVERGGGEQLPVRAEGDLVHPVGVAAQHAARRAVAASQSRTRAVVRGRGEQASVRAPRHAVHVGRRDRADRAGSAPVAASKTRARAVEGGRRDARAVRAPRHRVHVVAVALEQREAARRSRRPRRAPCGRSTPTRRARRPARSARRSPARGGPRELRARPAGGAPEQQRSRRSRRSRACRRRACRRSSPVPRGSPIVVISHSSSVGRARSRARRSFACRPRRAGSRAGISRSTRTPGASSALEVRGALPRALGEGLAVAPRHHAQHDAIGRRLRDLVVAEDLEARVREARRLHRHRDLRGWMRRPSGCTKTSSSRPSTRSSTGSARPHGAAAARGSAPRRRRAGSG